MLYGNLRSRRDFALETELDLPLRVMAAVAAARSSRSTCYLRAQSPIPEQREAVGNTDPSTASKFTRHIARLTVINKYVRFFRYISLSSANDYSDCILINIKRR